MSEITIVRRVRRPKESPPFYKMETDEKVKEWEALINIDNQTYGLHDSLKISPYTDLIPISYLLCRNHNVTDEFYVNDNTIRQVFNISWYGSDPAECFTMYDGNVRPTGQSPIKWRGFLSMYENHTPIVLPVILPVILPENLVYQKLYILKHGKIDLTKVIVLIDKELDSTSYPTKRTREIYRKELLPLIQTTACDVWKVPQSFIKKSCFMQDFKLRATGIRERKQEKQDIMNKFRESIYPINTDRVIDLGLSGQSITVSEGLAGRLTSTGTATGVRVNMEGRVIPEENLPW